MSLFSLLKNCLFHLYGKHMPMVPPFLSLNNVCNVFQLRIRRGSGSFNNRIRSASVLTWSSFFHCCNGSLYSQHFLLWGTFIWVLPHWIFLQSLFRLCISRALLVKRNLACERRMFISKTKCQIWLKMTEEMHVYSYLFLSIIKNYDSDKLIRKAIFSETRYRPIPGSDRSESPSIGKKKKKSEIRPNRVASVCGHTHLCSLAASWELSKLSERPDQMFLPGMSVLGVGLAAGGHWMQAHKGHV